jgi:two-component system LytT family response regulator
MRLEKYPQIQVVQSCQNGKEALTTIAELVPDLVFLDIQMPGLTGFDVVKMLQQDNMPAIVFVTAYDAFAVDAFTANAVDYLLKPVEDDRLEQTIARVTEHVSRKEAAMEKQRLLDIVIALTGKSRGAINQLLQNAGDTSQYSDRIAIKDGSSTTFVPVKDIDWVDAAGDYMCVHVGGRRTSCARR